ncbi:hypothetical protein LPJ75_000547 [Coemansia sp. RSA 2598]|nr:hypothetical protein LPJ75_000547 [Coemansia sp. RSA 2598]
MRGTCDIDSDIERERCSGGAQAREHSGSPAGHQIARAAAVNTECSSGMRTVWQQQHRQRQRRQGCEGRWAVRTARSNWAAGGQRAQSNGRGAGAGGTAGVVRCSLGVLQLEASDDPADIVGKKPERRAKNGRGRLGDGGGSSDSKFWTCSLCRA